MSSRFVPVHMGSPRFDVLEVGGFRVTAAWFPPDLVLQSHVHERPIFAVMLEGSFQDVFKSRTYECPPSTVFTEPAGERHANRIGNAGAWVMVVQPDPRREELLYPCRELFRRMRNFRHGRIAEQAWGLARELDGRDTITPLAVEGLVLDMLATAARVGPDEENLAGEPPCWLEQAQEMIHERFAEGLRIVDIADEVGVHPSHLARVFRARYRVPIGAYVRRLRLDWAADRLLQTEEPLSVIAIRAGYADQSHFTRAFKRRTGFSPGRYRACRKP